MTAPHVVDKVDRLRRSLIAVLNTSCRAARFRVPCTSIWI